LSGLSALAPPGLAAVLVVVTLGVFGHGETLWSPTGNALPDDLAPPHLRGRYNALGSLTWQLAMIAGPVMSGLLLDTGHTGAEVGVLLLAGAAVVAPARALERRLTPAQNGIAGDVPARTAAP
jgi:MFS family permease